jgi:hypothetical protein
MAKVLCALYDDPVDGYPKSYPRDDIPKITRYPDGQSTPTPENIDFRPGTLLGSVSGALGLRTYLEQQGHEFVVTSDKDGPDSLFERELPDADIVISRPFWPAYLATDRIAKAKRLKLALTAGVGSDHVDLQAAMERGITVAEVTYCNSISVSEHVVMMILAQVRNYILSYQWVVNGGWNIADCSARAYDVEGMMLDHPAPVERGVVLGIAPTDLMYAQTDKSFATRYFWWFFQIQDAPLPERFIGARPDYYVESHLAIQSKTPGAVTPGALAAYVRTYSEPAAIHAVCEDYHAAAGIDSDLLTASRTAGQKMIPPLLAIWGGKGTVGQEFDVVERAYALIGLAHPEFRDELTEAARLLHFI